MSTKERVHELQILRDAKQSEILKIADTTKKIKIQDLDSIIRLVDPLRTTIDSLNKKIDSLEGKLPPHKRWKDPGPNGE